jgi:hypothetical protein
MNDLGFLSRNTQADLDYNVVLTKSNILGIQSRKTTLPSINQYNIDEEPAQFGQSIGRAWDYNYNNNNRFYSRVLYLSKRVGDRPDRGTGDFRIPERSPPSSFLRSIFSSNPAQNIALSLSLEDGHEDLGS